MTRLLVNAAWPRAGGPRPADVAAAIQAAGGDGLGLPDSPRLFDDPLLATDRVLAETDVAMAGPCVLALGLRHPATVVGGLGTLAGRHGPRLLAVLARGESAVRNETLPVPSLRHYLAALDTVVAGLADARQGMTLLGSASGPRTLTETATRVDGVLIDAGAAAEVVSSAVGRVREANPAAQAWLFLRVLASDDSAERAAAVAPLLGSCAARLAAAPDWYQVPGRLRAEVAGLAAAHDYAKHGTAAASTGDTSEAAAFVADRFFVVGDAAAVRARIEAVTASGIHGVVLSGAVGGLLRRMGATVAAVRAGLAVQAGLKGKRA
jgi:hypothetical protein